MYLVYESLVMMRAKGIPSIIVRKEKSAINLIANVVDELMQSLVLSDIAHFDSLF